MSAPTHREYLRHITEDSTRFRAVLENVSPDAAVPTCPGWTAADLLWHLIEVHYFWALLVRERFTDPSQFATVQGIERPKSYAELLTLAERVAEELTDVLASTPPQTQIWTWAEDNTAGFVLRRQAHEALIHRIDAECTAQDRGPMDAALSADGVDEMLRVMLGGSPDGAEPTVDELATVRLQCTDTGDRWVATLAEVTIPDDEGNEHQEPTLLIADSLDELPTAATVSAAAADLDCWLWNRPALGAVELSGDVAVLARFREVVSEGVQ